MKALHRVNVHNMTLSESVHGADEDTFGENKVWILDTLKFPFSQAELCLQFHNNQTGHYGEKYHELRSVLAREGRLHHTTCPTNFIC